MANEPKTEQQEFPPIISAAKVAKRAAISPDELAEVLANVSEDFFPRPVGREGSDLFWLQSDIDYWINEMFVHWFANVEGH